MAKCYSDSNCESDHVGHGEMLNAIRGFEEAQGLFCLLDGHWGRVFDRNSYCGRQNLEDIYGYEYVSVESSSISELQAFSSPTRDVFSKATDAEWILYQQPASQCNLVTPIKSMDRYAVNTVIYPDSNVKGGAKQITAELSFPSVLCAASKVEACPYTGITKPRSLRMNQPLEFNADLSSLKGGLSCQTANSKQFTATIPHRGRAYTENFSAKEPASTTGQAHTETYKLPPLVSSLVWGEDCTANARTGFYDGRDFSLQRQQTAESSLRRTPSCDLLSDVMEPFVIPETLQEHCVHDRSSRDFDDQKPMLKAGTKKAIDAKKHVDEILGEALCHAQTRARLAEKAAAQAVQERERLAQLLFRETWTTRTYKQLVQALELENRLLKLCLNFDIKVWIGIESMHAMEHSARTSWMLGHKRRPFRDTRNLPVANSRQSRDGTSHRPWKEKIMLQCALGLAFVLGLSIAGAGLMIGWSMGWILFL